MAPDHHRLETGSVLPVTAPLLIRFGRIGDMVLQTPLLNLLHRRFDHPCTLLTSGPWSRELFAGDPDVGEIWQLRARHLPFLLSPERWSLVRRLRQHRGPIFISEDSHRHLPKIRRLLALSHIASDRCLFLDQFPATQNEHWVDQLLRLGQATPAALDPSSWPPPANPRLAPRLLIEDSDRADRDTWLRQRGIYGRPLVLLQPGNKRAIKWRRARPGDKRAWPVERWSGLLRGMIGTLPEAVFLLCGSPAEEPLLRDVGTAAGDGRIEIACSDLPLRRLMAVLEVAHSMVSVDTGPAHIAAAVGCPLVVIYGNENPHRWRRRSAVGKPVVEVGGLPAYGSAAEIPLEPVIDAWRSVLGA